MEPSMQDLDVQTLRRVLAGEREEFRGLVERNFAATYAAALARSGNAVEAEDIVQEAFLRAFLKLDTLKNPERFGAWVVQIARNLSSDRRRTLNRETVENGAAVSIDVGPEVLAARKEAEAIVSSAMMKLRRPDREILLMHYYAGHTAREVAEVLGVSRSAVLKRLERARKKLGDTFQEDKLDRTALRDLMVSTSTTVMRNVLGATVAWQAARTAVGTTAWAAFTTLTPKASTVAACFVGMGFSAIVGWSYFARDGVDDAGAITVQDSNPPTLLEADPASIAAEIVTDSVVATPEPLQRQAQSDTVDNLTNPVTSTINTTDEQPTYKDVNGLWDITALLANIEEEELGRMRFVDTGASLYVDTQNEDLAAFFSEIHRDGSDVRLVMAHRDATGVLEGAFNDELTEMLAKGVIETGAGSIPNSEKDTLKMDITLIARRVTESVLQRDITVNKLIVSIQETDRALERHVQAYGHYPETLNDLVPRFVSDSQLIIATATRSVKYVRSLLDSPEGSNLARLIAAAAAEPDPDELALIEDRLEDLWGGRFMESLPIIDVQDSELNIHLALTSNDRIEEIADGPKLETDLELMDRQRMSRALGWNSSCSNNLKQLEHAMKMFASEHAAHLYPAGWRMVYGEFLVDNRVLTCPSHPERTESYEILFPASNREFLYALTRTVEGLNEDVSTGVMASYVPLVIETSECSGLKGRNVLFLDGHVERVADEHWDADIGPYLAYR